MGQCQADSSVKTLDLPPTDPILYYMPIAARGEVSRLIAAVGGTKLVLNLECPDSVKKAAGSPSSLPILVHGDSVVLSQSHAIVGYMLSVSPKYRNLTPAQLGKDLQINAIMDDICSGIAKVLFDPQLKTNQDFGKTEITKVADKWIPVIEGIMPSSGFINGLPFPTAADFAMLVLAQGTTPFEGGWKLAELDIFQDAQKLKGVVDRTAAVPEVAAHLVSSTTFKGNPFGLPA